VLEVVTAEGANDVAQPEKRDGRHTPAGA
jgi:hypothetical protein